MEKKPGPCACEKVVKGFYCADDQKDLVTQFAVQNKLGALSNADMDLAVGGTADLFQFGNGVEARLSRLSEESMRSRIDRVATYPGAPPKSAGVMPGSFTAGK